MRLTAEQRNAVVLFLESKWPPSSRKCPLCGAKKWAVDDNITYGLGTNRLDVGSQASLPMVGYVLVYCRECGLAFNLLQAVLKEKGVLPSE